MASCSCEEGGNAEGDGCIGDSGEQKHEYGLLGAAVYMMLPISRDFMCQLALPWGTMHLISPVLAGKDVMAHSFR
jgi:hypothetical protein